MVPQNPGTAWKTVTLAPGVGLTDRLNRAFRRLGDQHWNLRMGNGDFRPRICIGDGHLRPQLLGKCLDDAGAQPAGALGAEGMPTPSSLTDSVQFGP